MLRTSIRRRGVLSLVAGALSVGLLAGCGGAPATSQGGGQPAALGQVKLLETGSSLLYPLFNIWVPAYTKDHANVQLTTQSTGSGTGISEAIKGTAQIGASDAYLADQQMKQNQGMLNIPLAISAQQVNYNLPGLNDKHLNLSGPVLAGMYDGSIKFWDDPQLAQLNPGVQLPHDAVVPVHRSDGSGDSFLFTQYLSFSTPSWKDKVGFGTSPNWPAVQGAVGANGNAGMVQALKQTQYAVAYVGVSFLDQATKAGLGYAALQNKAGKFTLPTAAAIKAEADGMTGSTPADMRVSLIYGPGDAAYPIINYEYAIVNSHQPNAATASALKDFLTWAVSGSGGNAASFLDQVHFLPLPDSIAKQSQALIAKIS